MIHFLFETGGKIAPITIVPTILLALIVPAVVAFSKGKGGGRSAEGEAATNWTPGMMVSVGLAVLAALQFGIIVLGGIAVKRATGPAGSGIGETVAALLLGPSRYDRTWLAGGGLGLLFLGVVGAFGMYEISRDGGWLRERIDVLRDPNRTRGESGSAHFATQREFARFRKEDKSGLPLVGAFWGATQSAQTGKRSFMRLDDGKGMMHISGEDTARGMLTIGGPGSGKTQSVILPAIADHMANGHSIIVVDPQGELTDHVKRYAAVTKHQVIVHDPTSNTCPRYNLAAGISGVSDARSIAEVLIPGGSGDNKFWTDSASMLLSACLIRFDNLGDIYTAMSDMELVGGRLQEEEDDASRLANSFLASLQTDGKIASNVVAVLATALTGWADTTARKTTASADFNAAMIVEQPTAVVLACPGRQRAIYAPYLGAVLRKLMLDLDTIGERNKGPLPIPVGVILDEFPTLGKLDSLVTDVNLVRKRRIAILLAAQTKGQFHLIYGPPGTDALFAGMATQIVFGGSDQETADFYARASGQATELTEVQGGFKLSGPESEMKGPDGKPQRRQRQLLTSDEIQTPAKGNATIFTRYVTESYATQLIMWAKLTRSYEREDWKEKLGSLKPEDAFVIQRPIEFGVKAEKEKAPAK